MEQKTNEQYVELDEYNIIMKVPIGTVWLEAKVRYAGDDGTLHEVLKRMNPHDLMEARQNFLENVEDGDDYDVRYTLTENGRKLAESLIRRDGKEEAEDD